MQLTKYERETIILFNEAEDIAEIATYNQCLKGWLESLVKRYPHEVKQTKRGANGYRCYLLPKQLVTICEPAEGLK